MYRSSDTPSQGAAALVPKLIGSGVGDGAALLFGLPLWRVDFYSKPKPIFSDQEPGIYIF
jgi:hypothetical protein